MFTCKTSKYLYPIFDTGVDERKVQWRAIFLYKVFNMIED